jgi:sugar phosphate isomerase/epimerase
MKIGLYSITYLGVWYRGNPIALPDLFRLAKREGWEGIELDTKRPHASPMDLSPARRKELRDLAAELSLPICAVSPNCDLSSPVPEQREAMICYVRECIELARDLGAPICKIFAAWRGVAVRDGLASYEYTKADPFSDWASMRWPLVREGLLELAPFARENGVTLALQNHSPVVRDYRDVLAFIREVGSPALQACMDIPIEGNNSGSDEWARKMVRESGAHQVHSHYNGEFERGPDGRIRLAGKRQIAYAAYVEALVKSGYRGFMSWEFCHPALEKGRPAGIEYIHAQTRLALEFMKELRARAGGG